MQKSLWSNNRKEIIQLLTCVISERQPVGIKIPGLPADKALALKLHYHHYKPFLILSPLPIPLPRGQSSKTAFFKVPGKPLLSFNWSAFYQTEKLLAIEVPHRIDKIQLRRSERYLAPQGSIVTFFKPAKQRLSLCRLSDISSSGAKIEGTPVYPLLQNDAIGPFTISMSEYQALIVREVTLSSSRIAWIDRLQDNRIRAGIRFTPTRKEHIQLVSHLEYLTKQSPFPFKAAESPFSVF